MDVRNRILSDDEAFASIKETSQLRYKMMWNHFRSQTGKAEEFELRHPDENKLLDYFRILCTQDGEQFY